MRCDSTSYSSRREEAIVVAFANSHGPSGESGRIFCHVWTIVLRPLSPELRKVVFSSPLYSTLPFHVRAG